MVKMKETGLTLGSSAYEAIRSDIMEGRFEPGAKLQFDALRQRYGIGISPIREALSRLHSEGWVARVCGFASGGYGYRFQRAYRNRTGGQTESGWTHRYPVGALQASPWRCPVGPGCWHHR